MARHFLSQEIRSGTLDESGFITFYKDREAVEPITLRWDDVLDGDKILTSIWTSEGGNLSSQQASILGENSTTIVIGGTAGTWKNTVTTERGYTYVRRIRVIERYT